MDTSVWHETRGIRPRPFSANIFKNREVEKDHFFYLAENEGVFMNDAGEGFLHGTSAICPVFGVITKDGFTGDGSWVLTDIA